ncbi:MAG: hypothetical protein Q7S57_04395 [bacterium]|nr:hypothetical protein [bacterium]
MLFFIGTVYVVVWRKIINLVGGTLMVLAIVMGLTSVLSNQHFV